MAAISAQSYFDKEGITAKNVQEAFLRGSGSSDEGHAEEEQHAEDANANADDQEAYADEGYDQALRGGGYSEAADDEAVEQFESDAVAEAEELAEADAEAEGLRGGGSSVDEAAFEDLVMVEAIVASGGSSGGYDEDAEDAEYPAAAAAYATEPPALRGGGKDGKYLAAEPQQQAQDYAYYGYDQYGLRGGSTGADDDPPPEQPVQNVSAVDENGNVVNTVVIDLSAFSPSPPPPPPEQSNQPQIVVIQQGDQEPVVIDVDGTIQALSAMSGGPAPTSTSQLGQTSSTPPAAGVQAGIQVIDMSSLAAQLQAAAGSGGVPGTIELQPGQQQYILSMLGAAPPGAVAGQSPFIVGAPGQVGAVAPPPAAPSAPPPAPPPKSATAKASTAKAKGPAGAKSKAPAKASKAAGAKGKAGKLSAAPGKGKGDTAKGKGKSSAAPAKGKGDGKGKAATPAKGKGK